MKFCAAIDEKDQGGRGPKCAPRPGGRGSRSATLTALTTVITLTALRKHFEAPTPAFRPGLLGYWGVGVLVSRRGAGMYVRERARLHAPPAFLHIPTDADLRKAVH